MAKKKPQGGNVGAPPGVDNLAQIQAQLQGWNPLSALQGYQQPAPTPPVPAPPPPAPAPPPPVSPPPAQAVGQPLQNPAFQPPPAPAGPPPSLTQAGGPFNNLTPYDSQQGLTGLQEQGIGQVAQGQNQINQAAQTMGSALPQIQTAANTMGTGVGTIGQAGGLQNQAVGDVNAVNPAVANLANTGIGQANTILSGANLNPSTNPYLAGTAQAANQALIDQYAQAVAPGLAAEATQAYGGPGATASSAFQQAQKNNEDALLRGLSQQDVNIYGQNYANAQNQISNTLGQLPGIQSAAYTPSNELLNAAQGLLGTGQAQVGAGVSQLGVPGETLNVGTGQLNAGNSTANLGLGEFGAGQAQFGQQNQTIDQLLGIGGLQQQQGQQGLNTQYGNAAAGNQYPMNLLSQYGSLLGQATGGTGNQVSVGSQSK